MRKILSVESTPNQKIKASGTLGTFRPTPKPNQVFTTLQQSEVQIPTNLAVEIAGMIRNCRTELEKAIESKIKNLEMNAQLTVHDEDGEEEGNTWSMKAKLARNKEEGETRGKILKIEKIADENGKMLYIEGTIGDKEIPEEKSAQIAQIVEGFRLKLKELFPGSEPEFITLYGEHKTTFHMLCHLNECSPEPYRHA